MTESFAELKARILSFRPVCENCWVMPSQELHHCIVKDCKQYHKMVTCEENLMPVCIRCHPYCNGIKVRMVVAQRQIEEYGFDIKTWYRELPLRFKEDWILML